MGLSRREFVRRFGAGSAGVAAAAHIIGYGREDIFAFEQGRGGGQRPAMSGPRIRLSSNENLRGPSPKVIEALKAAPDRNLGLGYPPVHQREFTESIAKLWGCQTNNVTTASGSGAELVAGVLAFCQT